MVTVTIDEKEYDTDDLSDEAKAQYNSINATDTEITRINLQLAIHQTARNAYARALNELLPKDDED